MFTVKVIQLRRVSTSTFRRSVRAGGRSHSLRTPVSRSRRVPAQTKNFPPCPGLPALKSAGSSSVQSCRGVFGAGDQLTGQEKKITRSEDTRTSVTLKRTTKTVEADEA